VLRRLRQQPLDRLEAERQGAGNQFRVVIGREVRPGFGQGVPDRIDRHLLDGAARQRRRRQEQHQHANAGM
jgi:hypothetical protein